MRQVRIRVSFWLQKKNILYGQSGERLEDEQIMRTATEAESGESIDKCCDIAFAKRILQGSHFLYDKLL